MAQRETATRPSPAAGSPMTATAAAQRHAAREWAGFRARLATVTPQAIARAALAAGVLAGTGLLASATWPALLPFVIGGLIAYQLLPVVEMVKAQLQMSELSSYDAIEIDAAILVEIFEAMNGQ